MAVQLSLLEPVAPLLPALPEGFLYRLDLLPPVEEGELVERFADLPLREFEFRGFLGKRRVVSFGLRYDFADSRVHLAEPIPDFLLSLRQRAASFAGLAAEALEHALVTEYAPGAAIGWHRDRPQFGDVIGISFLSSCRFRFRRSVYPHLNPPPQAGEGGVRVSRRRPWERSEINLQPRSAYLLRGAARGLWEHSIPPAESLRYSVTFRTMRAR
ncbi:MAG: alpha-ketoglutarate-dependent dioxygenase AlkB [Thiohalocapsa sp.]